MPPRICLGYGSLRSDYFLTYIDSRYIIKSQGVSTLAITIVDIIGGDVVAKQRALTQPMYYVLLSLKESRHGYEIMQYIDELTDGRVKVGPGTLYSLLARFEEDDYIEMVSEEDNKKTYIITSKGNRLLNGEIRRLKSLLNDANKVLGGGLDEI